MLPTPLQVSGRSVRASSYVKIVAVVLLASLVRVPLARVAGEDVPFITQFPAIIYASWTGGLTGGMIATLLAAAITLAFVFPHPHGLRSFSYADLASLVRFSIAGITLSVLGQARLRAHRQTLAKSDELVVSANATREYEARCAAIVAAALDCVITVDEHSVVVEWNPACEATFGLLREEALGQPMSKLIIPERYREAHERGMARFLATGEDEILGRRLELPALRASGEEFLAELTVVPIRTGVGYLFTAYLRDVSERERLAKQRRTLLQEILVSATDGKLRLCHTAAELPPCLDDNSDAAGQASSRSRILVSIEPPYAGVAHLRHLVRDEAERLGFTPDRRDDLITAASEAAMNAATHVGAGQAEVLSSAERGLIQVIVTDQGGGIEMDRLPRATLSRGYSTNSTLGHGFKIMIEMVDRLYLCTGSAGTTVVLEQYREKLLPPWLADE